MRVYVLVGKGSGLKSFVVSSGYSVVVVTRKRSGKVKRAGVKKRWNEDGGEWQR